MRGCACPNCSFLSTTISRPGKALPLVCDGTHSPFRASRRGLLCRRAFQEKNQLIQTGRDDRIESRGRLVGIRISGSSAIARATAARFSFLPRVRGIKRSGVRRADRDQLHPDHQLDGRIGEPRQLAQRQATFSSTDMELKSARPERQHRYAGEPRPARTASSSDVHAVHHDAAGVGLRQSQHLLQQGGLSRTASASKTRISPRRTSRSTPSSTRFPP